MRSSSGYEVKVLVLDFDGVITSLDLDWGRVKEEVSRAVGFRIVRLRRFWCEYFGTGLFRRVNELVKRYEVEALGRAEPFPEAASLILGACGRARIYIATLQPREPVAEFLERHGLRRCVAGILTREEFPNKKEMLRWVLENEGVEPRHVLFIDDSEDNIEQCRELGINCFHVDRDRAGQNLLEILRVIGI